MAKKLKRLQVDISPDKVEKLDSIRAQLGKQKRYVPSRAALVDRALEFALGQNHWLLP